MDWFLFMFDVFCKISYNVLFHKLNSAFFLRYLYCCWFKTVGILNEEMYHQFFVWFNLLAGSLVALVLSATGLTKYFAIYRFCSHLSLAPSSLGRTSNSSLIGIFGSILVLHISIVSWMKVSKKCLICHKNIL